VSWQRTKYPGIYVRHGHVRDRNGDNVPCPGNSGGRCRCRRAYRVRYRDDAGKPKWSAVMYSEAEARNWQTDRRRGAGMRTTEERFRELWERWLRGARSGAIAKRGGEPYAARTLTLYEENMDRDVLPTYGDRPAASLTAQDWQLLIDALHRGDDRGGPLSRNSLQVIKSGVGAVYRWACAPTRGYLHANTFRGLEMPARDEKARDRIAPPAEARQLLDVLAQSGKCYDCDVLDFALALYAGLRNCEREPLDWAWIELDRRRIRVRKSKTKAGIRTVPIIDALLPILKREWLRQGKPATGRVVRGPKGSAVSSDRQAKRVRKAWSEARLEAIRPHECRHTFASYLIAAGLNAKAVTVLLGHASIQTTFDRYGHLFPGHEDEAAERLNAYIEAAVTNGVTKTPRKRRRRAKNRDTV
jgi:integrase